MLRPVLQYPDPRLAQKADAVEEITDEIRELAQDLMDTLTTIGGVGIAAPQIGVFKRVIVLDVSQGLNNPDAPQEFVPLINPVVTVLDPAPHEENEGCLSVPGVYGYVTRPTWAKIRAQDRFGNWFEREGEGIVAQCFCHETEHLDGHLFTEKVEEYIDPEAMQGGDEE